MANLTPSTVFTSVYQLERTDFVDAGLNGDGKANRQAQELLNRTEYLYASVIGSVVPFPVSIIPASGYIPCDGNDSILSDPSYSLLSSRLPLYTVTMNNYGGFISNAPVGTIIQIADRAGASNENFVIGQNYIILSVDNGGGFLNYVCNITTGLLIPISGSPSSGDFIRVARIPIVPLWNGLKFYIKAF